MTLEIKDRNIDLEIKEMINEYKSIIKNSLIDEIYKWQLINNNRINYHSKDEFVNYFESYKSPPNLIYHMSYAVVKDLIHSFPDEMYNVFNELFDEDIKLEKRIINYIKSTKLLYDRIKKPSDNYYQDERTIAYFLTLKYPDKYTFYKEKFYSGFCNFIGVKKEKVNNKYIHFLSLMNDFKDSYISNNSELTLIYKEKLEQYSDIYNDENNILLAQNFLYMFFEKTTDNINYWIFQGNPKLYDFENTLKNNQIKTWTVTSHRDKIKKDDLVIIWLTGANSGCYALAKVLSEPKIIMENDPNWKEENKNEIKVEIEITHNLFNSPILKNELNNFEVFNDFKAGNQGTNFSATVKQYNYLLSLWFNKILKYSFNQEIIDNYIDFLTQIIKKYNFEINDQRLYFNYLINNDKITRLIFVVGQRYTWVLDSKEGFGAISREVFSDKTEEFNTTNNKDKNPVFINWTKDYNLILNNKEHIYTAIENELKSAKKSSFRSENKIDFEEYVFNNLNQIPMKTQKQNYPLNQILYGPPGTGKTYNTIMLAAQILKNGEEEVTKYERALEIYNQALGSQIEFVTFHQNFSYEDFIQGLRPDPESEGIKFKKSDGIFKRIVNEANRNLIESLKAPIEVSERQAFIDEIDKLKEKITDNNEKIRISDSAYLYTIEEDAFRYTGDNWTLNDKGFNGFRMRYSDLIEIFDNNITERKQIKELSNISGLAKQHATYFFNTYKLLKDSIKINKNKIEKIKLKPYIIIIDEINRANISRVFGELITLIEEDKRWDGDPKKVKWEVTLPSGDKFKIPNNLYIIGTMNTADKSIALLDVALRRRFVFNAYYPLYEIEENKYKYADDLKKLNDLIVGKLGKGRGHDLQIGHSYFMNLNTDKEFEESINNKVIPLLLEYFMNNVDDVETLIKDFLKGRNFELIVGSYPLKIKVAE